MQTVSSQMKFCFCIVFTKVSWWYGLIQVCYSYHRPYHSEKKCSCDGLKFVRYAQSIQKDFATHLYYRCSDTLVEKQNFSGVALPLLPLVRYGAASACSVCLWLIFQICLWSAQQYKFILSHLHWKPLNWHLYIPCRHAAVHAWSPCVNIRGLSCSRT